MIEIPVSIGEVVDKITILQIKQEKITDSSKLKNISYELDLLNRKIANTAVPKEMIDELSNINNQLWEIEDAIRVCEMHKDFEKEFIELARSVYINNDKRASLKKQINIYTQSDLIEEKSYSRAI